MNFRSRKPEVGQRLSRDEQARRSGAVNAALAAQGSADALAFLNTYHAGLRGRPLDFAIASDTGLAAVEAALRGQARGGIESP